MPLFDVGTERSPLVVLARPEEPAFDADARTVVQEHLAALLGEKAFTVTGNGDRHGASASASPEPTIALDSTGATVVVVVAAALDDGELAAALAAAGRASRLTRAELADLYPAGADRFHKDVTDFYDALPATGPARSRGGTVRLVVVCSDVTPAVHDALAFLRTAGPCVEVFQVGVLPAAPGRRLVDVSPLAPAGRTPAPELKVDTPSAVPVGGQGGGLTRRVVERAPTGPVAAVPVGRVSAPVASAALAGDRGIGQTPAPGQLTGPVRTSAFGTSSFPPVPAAPSAGDMTTILPPVPATDYPVYSEPPVETSSELSAASAWETPTVWEEPSWDVRVPLDAETAAPPVLRRTGQSPLSAPLPVVELPPPGTPYTPIFLSVPDMIANLPARPAGGPVLDEGPRTALDLSIAPADDSGYVAGPGESAAWEGSGTGLTGHSAYRASAFIAAKKYMPEKLERAPRVAPGTVLERTPPRGSAGVSAAARYAPTPDGAAADEWLPLGEPLTSDVPVASDGPSSLALFDDPGSPFWADLSAQLEPVRFDPPEPSGTGDDDASWPGGDLPGGEPGDLRGPTDEALVTLASALREALPLVWVRHRRGERFEATLHPDGTLETSDGSRFADPSWAANEVSGSTAADGWRVWRAGESGPTLAELLG